MTGTASYDLVLWTLFAVAPIVLLALLFVPAPYGRHARGGWGPTMPTRLAWIVMESPAVLAFGAFYALGPNARATVPLLLCALWLAHYVQRTFIFPFRIRVSPDRRTPVAVAAMAIVFNLGNAWVNATWLSRWGSYPTEWLAAPAFWAGAAMFAGGYGINRWADERLRALRRPGESGHAIPRGGLYELISCPNYFGETVQWFGWAIATWSLGGLAFALFTTANLLPRALSHHRWYQQHFADYPAKRRAFVPFVW